MEKSGERKKKGVVGGEKSKEEAKRRVDFLNIKKERI